MANIKNVWDKAVFCFAPYSGRLDESDKQPAAMLAGPIYIGESIAEAIRDAPITMQIRIQQSKE